MTRTLTRAEIEDILVGATVFGAGGGGDLSEGLDLIDAAQAAGKTFRLAALADVPDTALLCTPYLLGAISDLPEQQHTTPADHPILRAFDRLTAYLGQPVFGTIACELGGSNTAVPFFVAAMTDAVVIDADPAGRAVPEITHSSYFLNDLPASPIVAANARGECMILERIADDQRAETVVRALAQVSDNDIAAIDHALPAAQLRGALLPGTLSRAGRVGALLRAGQAAPDGLPQQIAAAAGGRVAFTGTVTQSTTRTDAGFTVGRFTIAGHGADAGATFKVALKNENMAAWRNGAVAVTIPEIITVMDRDTGTVVTNPHVQVGQNVAVLTLPAPEIFLSPRGLDIFGPRYAGVAGAFRPTV